LAIHRLQRKRETLAGLIFDEEREEIVHLHKTAQRLLKCVHVINPFAEELSFANDRTRTRRDQPKYLALIRTIALLKQYQRPIKTLMTKRGKVVEYIEVELADIELANRLTGDALRRTASEMPAQTERVLVKIAAFVSKRAEEKKISREEVRFTRREIREAMGIGNTQVMLHLQRFLGWCDERAVVLAVDVTRDVLEDYKRHLFHRRKEDGRPLRRTTQMHVLGSVLGLFKWLTKRGLRLTNPGAMLELPRVERNLPHPALTPAEVEQVLGAIDVTQPLGLRDRTILEMAYSTGMRRIELAHVKLSDIDAARGTVLVRQGKGKKARVVPIGARALAWLEKYLEDVRPFFRDGLGRGRDLPVEVRDADGGGLAHGDGEALPRPRGAREAGFAAHLPAQRGDGDARGRGGHPSDPGVSRTREPDLDAGLHEGRDPDAEDGARADAPGGAATSDPARAYGQAGRRTQAMMAPLQASRAGEARSSDARVRTMNAVPAELLKAALALPAEAREQLLAELASSLEADGGALSEADEDELVARLERVRAGEFVEARDVLNRHARR